MTNNNGQLGVVGQHLTGEGGGTGQEAAMQLTRDRFWAVPSCLAPLLHVQCSVSRQTSVVTC